MSQNFMMEENERQREMESNMQYLQDNYQSMISQFGTSVDINDERVSGYPQPQLYDQHYINKYAYPKGLKCTGRRDDKAGAKKSLYDMRAPANRKGFSGWKLTKRPNDFDPFPDNSQLMLNGYNSTKMMPSVVGKNGRGNRLPPITHQKKKKKTSRLAKSYNNQSGGTYGQNQNRNLQGVNYQMNVQSSADGGMFTHNPNYKANIIGDSITNIQVGDQQLNQN